MSGGIAQLVAVGAQDAHLVGEPEVSFFRSTYKRHTNFAQTVERQVIQGNPSASGMSTVRFERKGDLLGYCYLAPNNGTNALTYTPAEWDDLVTKVEILIGGQVIDEQSSLFSLFIAPNTLSQSVSKSTTGFGAPTKSKFYPLRFAFCENWQSSIPLVALQYHDVELRITWGAQAVANSEKWECYAHYVHLDTEERQVLANTPQNMVITQTQKAIASNSKIQELSFNHPVKFLAVSKAGGADIDIAAAANKLKLQINGTDVADSKYVDPHFTAVTSYYHTAATKDDGAGDGDNKNFFLYPFCLDTTKLQPTGSLNFSRLDSARLVNSTANSADDVYAVNYNILRIENGMGGLMYSN